MIVVSNTSPIINLAAVGQLDLLRYLHGHILIPRAVYDEIVTNGSGQPGALEVQTSVWIEVRALTQPENATQWSAEVDVGEAEAITLSLEVGANRLLIDERLGRALASRLGIPILGTLGALVAAKLRRSSQSWMTLSIKHTFGSHRTSTRRCSKRSVSNRLAAIAQA